MPMPTREEQLKYQNEWMKRRRLDWLAENGPCIDCGSWERLEVDHVDPHLKITHRVWSWSAERRKEELAKCVVRCHECHVIKTASQSGWGEENAKHKLTEEQVREIRRRYAIGEHQTVIAASFGVAKNTICDLLHGRTWTRV